SWVQRSARWVQLWVRRTNVREVRRTRLVCRPWQEGTWKLALFDYSNARQGAPFTWHKREILSGTRTANVRCRHYHRDRENEHKQPIPGGNSVYQPNRCLPYCFR